MSLVSGIIENFVRTNQKGVYLEKLKRGRKHSVAFLLCLKMESTNSFQSFSPLDFFMKLEDKLSRKILR